MRVSQVTHCCRFGDLTPSARFSLTTTNFSVSHHHSSNRPSAALATFTMGTAHSQDNLYGGPYDFHDVVIIAHGTFPATFAGPNPSPDVSSLCYGSCWCWLAAAHDATLLTKRRKSNADFLITAVVASIAACILIPAGILTARWARGSPHWFPIHAALQSLGAVFVM